MVGNYGRSISSQLIVQLLHMEYKPVIPVHKKNIAIIGAGGIVTDAHLPAYTKAGFNVLAIYDRNTEKAIQVTERFKIPNLFRSLEGLIEFAQSRDCVYDIAVPASEIISILSLLPNAAGVLIQKPMGEDLNAANEILTICRTKKLVAGINFQLRHAPYIIAAKQLIDSGTIGDLHDIDVRITISMPWHLWDFLYHIPRMEILYNSIHYIDMIRYFFGNPDQVAARTIKHPNCEGLANARSSIILDYGEWKRANINTNHGHQFGTRHQESYFKFEGTTGAIKIVAGLNMNYPEGVPDEFEYISLHNNKGWQTMQFDGSWFPDAFIGPMAGLMRKLEQPDTDYINSVEDAIYTMRVVEECYRSNEQLASTKIIY